MKLVNGKKLLQLDGILQIHSPSEFYLWRTLRASYSGGRLSKENSDLSLNLDLGLHCITSSKQHFASL